VVYSVLVSVSLFSFFVPLIIGSSLSPASPRTTALALPCLMLTFCLPMFITGVFDRRIRVPLRVSSLPPNSPLPPLTYTMVEDIVAVDGGGGLAFRHAWAHRYQSSLVMRRLLRSLALWWGATGIVIGAILIAAAWTAPENTAYGLGYGMRWLWAMIGAAATIVYVHEKLQEEARDWPTVHRDVQLRVQLTEDEADREVERRARWERRQQDRERRLSTMSPSNRDGVATRDFGQTSPPVSEPLPPRTPTPAGRPHTPPLETSSEKHASRVEQRV
jgi:hypothetical protein